MRAAPLLPRRSARAHRRHGRPAVMLLFLLSGGCVQVPATPSPSVESASAARYDSTLPAPAANDATTRHVIVVSIDGLRPDAIERFGARTLQRLMRQGSYTLAAQTILPSLTLPSHTSMLTGVLPEQHGITWNDDRTDREAELPVPTIFAIATDAGKRSAAFFSKAKFHHLQRDGTLHYTQAPRLSWTPRGADRTVDDARSYLRRHRPELLFVHIGEPDYAGHAVGFMSWVYGENVRIADRALQRLHDTAILTYGAGQFTMLVTSDHGGHGRDHGSDDPRDMTIPWIAYGQGVRPGTVLAEEVRTMDTAATALWLLGVGVPASWAGRVVTEAFDSAVTRTGSSGSAR